MADEIVNLNVDVDVKGDNKLLTTAAKITALDAASKRLENRTNRLTGAMGRLNLQMTQNSKGATQFGKQLSLVEKIGAKFLKMARMLMFTVIALGIEFGISALSLASVNAAFAVGKFVAQAYNYVMQALAGTVAAVGVAAIGAAAAFKEFQAAQFAFRYKDSKELGSALDQSGSGLRSLYKDSQLAAMGVQNLAGAFAAVSKHSAFTPASKAALRAMADFVQASGDPKNAMQAAGNLVGILQKEKKFTAEALQAVKSISPEFEKAFKKGNYKDYKKFLEDLQSGKLATEAGVLGQSGTMAQTLVGQFRTYMSSALVELSDVGVRVLEPIKKAMSEIYGGLERTFRRISGDLVAFGQGPFLSSLVKFTDKLEDFTVVLFRKFLPATEGFWRRTTDFFKGFAIYFREVRDALDPLRDGGSILIKTFGKPIVEIFKQIGKGVSALAAQAEKYEGLFLSFGDAMKSVVVGFFEIMRALREVFARALPIINPMLSALGKMMSSIASIINMISGKGGSFGSSGLVAALGFFALKGRRSQRFARNRGIGDEFGNVGLSPKQAIYSGHSFATMGSNVGANGAANQGQLGSIAGAMASPAARAAGAAAGAATSAAIAPGASALNAAGATLTSAGASLSAGAAALTSAALGATMRGGFGGGTVGGSGAILRAPNRKPGQSSADYYRDRLAYIDQQPGGRAAYKAQLEQDFLSKNGRLPTSSELTRAMMGQTTAADKSARALARAQGQIPLEQRGTRAGGRTAADRTRDFEASRVNAGRDKAGGARRAKEIAIDRQWQKMLNTRDYENMWNSPAFLEPAAAGNMSKMQRLQSFARAKKYRAGKRIQEYSNAFDANGGYRGAAKRMYGGMLNLGSLALNGQPTVSGAMGGLGVTGAAGSAGNNAARQGGLRGLAGRLLLGQSYNAEGFTGFRNTIRMQGGLGKLGPGSGLLGRAVGSAKGGNFGQGYRNAKLNFDLAKKEGLIPANAKFSKFQGMKAGAKYGLSGVNMLAGMGVSAFLGSGMGQKMVSDPDAQGAMQTGAAVAAINPLLGLAVGAGLTAFKSKTKMGGALAGAVSGAAIGGMIAGPLGAAVGGLVGSGLGFLAAKRNQKKMAEGAMGKVGLAQLSGIAAAAAKGGPQGSTAEARAVLAASQNMTRDFAKAGTKEERQKVLQPFIDAGVIGGNELSLALGDNAEDAQKALAKTSKTMKMALTPQFNQFDSLMNSLKQTTGMTSEEIYKLAMERNVDLYDTTLKLTDVTKALGVGMTRTAKQFSDALKDVQIKAMDVFRKFKENKDMKDALQSAGNNLRGGDTSTEAFLDYYTKYLDYSNYMSPDTPLLNAIAQAQAFGAGANVGAGSAFGPGGPLAGIAMGDEAKGLIGQAQTQTASGSATEMTKQLLAMTGEAGFTFKDGEKAFSGAQAQINKLITAAMGGDMAATAQIRDLEGMLSRGVAFKGKSASEISAIMNAGLFGTNTPNSNLFGTTLTTEMSGNLDPFKDILTEEAMLMRTQFTQAVRAEFFESTDTPKWWNQAPDWWANGFEAVLNDKGQITKLLSIGDTSTSKVLGKTMGKHSMFDSALPGKRTVTSSLRDFALGSNNSDHATGHAYDLVGDNLGKYSSLINAAGGFAEFHGTGGSRHLHVVPPVGPMGDTSTSILAKMTGSTSANSSSGGDTFNITVNESATPQVTARAVANEILQIQKNWKQRA